jgi:hypothetical protein
LTRVTDVILLGGVVTVLIAAGAMLTLKLPRPAAAHHVAEPLDPAILQSFLQRGRDEMALP